MDSPYLHGTSPAEQGRLSLMNRLVNEAAVRELALEGRESLVDFGCGLAQLTRSFARATKGRVVGIERSPEQLVEARRLAAADGEEKLVELRQGDAATPPLESDEWGAFDVAHGRFVLEHVQRPLDVVRQMVRAVRQGGRVVLQDDDHDILRLSPEPLGFSPLWAAYVRTYDRLGCDPFVGRKLVSLLHETGAQPVRSNWLRFGACAGESTFADVVANTVGIFLGARAQIVGGGLLEGDSFDRALDGLRAWAQRPDAAFWYAICWAEGTRR